MRRKLLVATLLSGLILLGLTTMSLGKRTYWDTVQMYEEATGNKIEEFHESPMLRVKVAAGELPPVAERIPEQPLVVDPFEEIGQYGGTLRGLAFGPSYWQDVEWLRRKDNLTLISLFDDLSLRPVMAKSVEISGDMKSVTIHLRKGLKWSDGVPFTADDIMFYIVDVEMNDELNPAVHPDFAPGNLEEIRKIDDYTVRIDFTTPNLSVIMNRLKRDGGQGWMFDPKHYLKKWHIKYNPKANELAKEEGFDHWWEAFRHHENLYGLNTDYDLPRVGPFVLTKATPSMMLSERNPYYFVVDTAGNQLPYIDNLVSHIVSPEVYPMRIISGEVDLAWIRTSLTDYPLYKENEEEGDYRTIPWPGTTGSELGLRLNLDEKDPVLRKLYRDVRFRQALSVAINREAINENVFFGAAVPRQATVLPACSFFKEEWAEAYAQYDPHKANGLLDELQLTERSKDDFRLLPKGKPLLLIIEYVEQGSNTPILELVKEYWEAVGVKVLLKSMESTLWATRMDTSGRGVGATSVGYSTELDSYTHPRYWTMGTSMGMQDSICLEWGKWLETNGKSGEEPPEDVKELYNLGEKLRTLRPGTKEYVELAQEIHDRSSKMLFRIGTVGMAPRPNIVKNNLRNFPVPFKDVSPYCGWEPISVLEQLFFKK